MQIFLDIDETIATTSAQLQIAAIAQAANFTPERTMEAKKNGNVAAIIEWPEVVARCAELTPANFNRLLSHLLLTPNAILRMTPIAGAVARTRWLSEQGELTYLTGRLGAYTGDDPIRRAAVEQLNHRTAAATTTWLAKHGFPHPEQVTYCLGPRDKLHRIATLLSSSGEDGLLIDDLIGRLFEEAGNMTEEETNTLSHRLSYIAFGHKDLPVDINLSKFRHCMSLPTWNEAERLTSILAMPVSSS